MAINERSADDEFERLLLANSPRFQALLDKSRRQIEKTGGIPHEEFWREVEAGNGDESANAKKRKRRTKS